MEQDILGSEINERTPKTLLFPKNLIGAISQVVRDFKTDLLIRKTRRGENFNADRYKIETNNNTNQYTFQYTDGTPYTLSRPSTLEEFVAEEGPIEYDMEPLDLIDEKTGFIDCWRKIDLKFLRQGTNNLNHDVISSWKADTSLEPNSTVDSIYG